MPAEGIRDWYRRTTRKARRVLFWSMILTASLGVVLFLVLPHSFSLSLQVYNGAYTIPVAGAIWITAFVVIWLVPMRELSFRGQESLERSEEKLNRALDEEIKPAARAVKLVCDRIQKEIDGGFFEEARDAFRSVKDMAGPKGPPPDPARVEIRRTAPPVAASGGNHKSKEA